MKESDDESVYEETMELMTELTHEHKKDDVCGRKVDKENISNATETENNQLPRFVIGDRDPEIISIDDTEPAAIANPEVINKESLVLRKENEGKVLGEIKQTDTVTERQTGDKRVEERDGEVEVRDGEKKEKEKEEENTDDVSDKNINDARRVTDRESTNEKPWLSHAAIQGKEPSRPNKMTKTSLMNTGARPKATKLKVQADKTGQNERGGGVVGENKGEGGRQQTGERKSLSGQNLSRHTQVRAARQPTLDRLFRGGRMEWTKGGGGMGGNGGGGTSDNDDKNTGGKGNPEGEVTRRELRPRTQSLLASKTAKK